MHALHNKKDMLYIKRDKGGRERNRRVKEKRDDEINKKRDKERDKERIIFLAKQYQNNNRKKIEISLSNTYMSFFVDCHSNSLLFVQVLLMVMLITL